MNNSLANGSNMFKWGRITSPLCPSYDHPQTLGHVVGGCFVHLKKGRYTYHHDSVLSNLAKSIPINERQTVYADIPGYCSPSIICGDDKRPDIVIVNDKTIALIELSVGFETNLSKNADAKQKRYERLLEELKTSYLEINYINLSMGAIGTFGKSCSNLKTVLQKYGLCGSDLNYTLQKMANVCIRTTYFIFCTRNKEWPKPDIWCGRNFVRTRRQPISRYYAYF